MKNFLICFIVVIGFSSCGVRFAVTTSGENLQALTKVTDSEEPCITPFGGDNGKDLYFAARENKKYFNIYKKDNPFSSAINQKTSGKNYNYSPSYSETIDKIVFRCQNEGSSTSDIYMMPNSKGKALTMLTESTDAFENNPCFSKDGKWVVYDKQSYSIARNINLATLLGLGFSHTLIEDSEVWMKNLETGETILMGNGYQPTFSPDGKLIAYVKYSTDAKSCSIWTMNLDGDNQVQITDARKGYSFYPRWSPDGKKIVFQTSKKDKKDADLYIVDIDGNNLTQITKNKSHDGTPYWTNDDFLYFVSDRGNKKGNYQIWRFKMD